VKIPLQVGTRTISILFTASALATNPFLDAKDDKPVWAKFHGAEWGDEIAQDEIALTARVITTRIATMAWGGIFKIQFVDLKSRAPQHREIPAEYLIVTDDRIVLVNEENNDEAVKRIAAMDKPPVFEEGNIYGITTGHFTHQEGDWKTTIELKGDRCVFDVIHRVTSRKSFGKRMWA
jgi:hypothetical protein